MECRETGEFAHRETTKYEQQETFNNEVNLFCSHNYFTNLTRLWPKKKEQKNTFT